MLHIRDVESVCSAGDPGSVPGSGRSLGGGHGHPSSLLASRIPWTEESDGIQSTGSQRVRHDWSDLAHIHNYCKEGKILNRAWCPSVKIISQPSHHWTLDQKLSRSQKLKELFTKSLIEFCSTRKSCLGICLTEGNTGKLSLCHRPSQKFRNLELLKNCVKNTGSTGDTRRKDNLHITLIDLRDARLRVKVFLGGSVTLFLEEISIWISEQSKAGVPPQCRWASSNLLRTQIKQKIAGRVSLLSFCLSWAIHLLLPRHWHSCFLGFQTQVQWQFNGTQNTFSNEWYNWTPYAKSNKLQPLTQIGS